MIGAMCAYVLCGLQRNEQDLQEDRSNGETVRAKLVTHGAGKLQIGLCALRALIYDIILKHPNHLVPKLGSRVRV